MKYGRIEIPTLWRLIFQVERKEFPKEQLLNHDDFPSMYAGDFGHVLAIFVLIFFHPSLGFCENGRSPEMRARPSERNLPPLRVGGLNKYDYQ